MLLDTILQMKSVHRVMVEEWWLFVVRLFVVSREENRCSD